MCRNLYIILLFFNRTENAVARESYKIPPLGFPKRFSVAFVHVCLEGCTCRPTASTCDITIQLQVHIRDEIAMKEIIVSAIQDSYGFDLI